MCEAEFISTDSFDIYIYIENIRKASSDLSQQLFDDFLCCV